MLNFKIEKRKISGINNVGLFAKEKILKNELIWKATDDTVQRITFVEFKKLSEEEKKNWVDHCYQIDDYLQMDIDDTRFMNHSCEPNTVDLHQKDQTVIVAGRDIQKDEEITWNYLPFMNPYQEFKCNCGSEKCVGIIKKQE